MILDFAVAKLKNIALLVRRARLVQTDDRRLKDERDPKAHTHSITDITGNKFPDILTGGDGQVLTDQNGDVMWR